MVTSRPLYDWRICLKFSRPTSSKGFQRESNATHVHKWRQSLSTHIYHASKRKLQVRVAKTIPVSVPSESRSPVDSSMVAASLISNIIRDGRLEVRATISLQILPRQITKDNNNVLTYGASMQACIYIKISSTCLSSAHSRAGAYTESTAHHTIHHCHHFYFLVSKLKRAASQNSTNQGAKDRTRVLEKVQHIEQTIRINMVYHQ